MRVLVVDGDGVTAGDALVAALADLGVKPSTFEWELSQVDVGDFHLHFDRPAGGGVRFSIHGGATHRHGTDDHEASHAHEPEHDHVEKPASAPVDVAKVRRAILASGLPETVTRIATGLLADAAEMPAGEPTPFTEVELGLAAESVLIAVGLTELRVEGVSFTGPSRGPGPAPAGMPPPASTDGLRAIQTGVGHGEDSGGRVTATLLEG